MKRAMWAAWSAGLVTAVVLGSASVLYGAAFEWVDNSPPGETSLSPVIATTSVAAAASSFEQAFKPAEGLVNAISQHVHTVLGSGVDGIILVAASDPSVLLTEDMRAEVNAFAQSHPLVILGRGNALMQHVISGAHCLSVDLAGAEKIVAAMKLVKGEPHWYFRLQTGTVGFSRESASAQMLGVVLRETKKIAVIDLLVLSQLVHQVALALSSAQPQLLPDQLKLFQAFLAYRHFSHLGSWLNDVLPQGLQEYSFSMVDFLSDSWQSRDARDAVVTQNLTPELRRLLLRDPARFDVAGRILVAGGVFEDTAPSQRDDFCHALMAAADTCWSEMRVPLRGWPWFWSSVCCRRCRNPPVVAKEIRIVHSEAGKGPAIRDEGYFDDIKESDGKKKQA